MPRSCSTYILLPHPPTPLILNIPLCIFYHVLICQEYVPPGGGGGNIRSRGLQESGCFSENDHREGSQRKTKAQSLGVGIAVEYGMPSSCKWSWESLFGVPCVRELNILGGSMRLCE